MLVFLNTQKNTILDQEEWKTEHRGKYLPRVRAKQKQGKPRTACTECVFFKLWRTQPVLLLFYCCIEMLATSKAFSVDSASSSTPRSTAAGTSHTINSAWSVLTISCKIQISTFTRFKIPLNLLKTTFPIKIQMLLQFCILFLFSFILALTNAQPPIFTNL